MAEIVVGLESVPNDDASEVTTAMLRAALARRGVAADIDDTVLSAVSGCAIAVDDPELCATALLDLGPMTVVDALENGSRWAGFVERLARSGSHAIVESVPEPRSPDAADVLRWLHIATGTAFVDMLRCVTDAGTDVDTGIDELAAAGVVRVSYPVRGPASETAGTRVAVTMSHLGHAADAVRHWAMAGGAELVPAMATAVDVWVRDDLRTARMDPYRFVGHASAMRRHGLVAIDRFAASGRWDDAVEIAETLAPALVAAGIYRALHRQVTALLNTSTSASNDIRCRLRSISAELHLASGDVDISRHLLNAATSPGPDNRDIRWRTELLAAVWAPRVDPTAVLRSVEREIAAGGSHTIAAEVTLDLASRLVHDGRPSDAHAVLTAAGAHAAVAGHDLLLARFNVTAAMIEAQIGDSATGRQRLRAAYPVAAAHGQHVFVQFVAGSTGAARHDTVSDGAAHLVDAVDALVGTGAFELDRDRLLATYVADHGPGWRSGSHRSPPRPALAAVHTMYPAIASGTETLHVVPDPTTEALTARESQVAELVAGGLSNVDIGHRLGISRWTVVSHLRNIMRKWDCTSRVEVALRYRQ
ncbi:helix-turn-helix transcriptional regulator [Rhodococcoides trifolii]|uniref:helix-turn-helix transcriptional regulator n=1 Tax=Rhodococcoides trifolii TaxID=908250 RepID=UPI001665175F|nr:LuxR C-terminal-related transcriptional regulator [Rhodococcus trifolii]